MTVASSPDPGSATGSGTATWLPCVNARWLPLLLPALVVVPVGALAALGSFDGLYGQDPFAYYDYAVGPLRESLLQLKPPPPFFWPPGYPILVALVSLIVGTAPPAGQFVSLLGGGLVPVFTALLAREVWAPKDRERQGVVGAPSFVPLAAGLLTAVNPQLWQSSAVIMSDTTGLATATLGIWALARYARRGNPGWLALAAAALAWAVLTRWVYALVAIPCVAFTLVVLGRRDGRVALVHGTAAAVIVGVALGPTVLPAVFRMLFLTGGTAPFVGDLQVYTWHPLNALRREFVTVDGQLRYAVPNGLYYAAAPAHWFFFTPVLASLIVPGLWAILRDRAAGPLLLIVGWAAMAYGFHAGAPWQNFRFTLAYLPPLAILLAIGVAYVCRGAGRRLGWIPMVALAVGLVWMASGGLSLTQRFIERKQSDLAVVRWAEAQVAPNGRLLSFNLTLTFRHYSQIETLDLFEMDPGRLAGLLSGESPVFVLLDVDSVESQWVGRAPSESYRYLRDVPGLVARGTQGPYTLFRVGEERP